MLTWIVGASSVVIFGSVTWLFIKLPAIQKRQVKQKGEVRLFKIKEISGEED